MRLPTIRTPVLSAALMTLLIAPLTAAEPPSPDELRRQAERCRHILKTSLVDFYLPACVDRTNGGYLESLHDGKFVPTGERFLVMQGRQLWFFSTLAQAGIEREAALAAAKTGFDFLEGRMRDRQHGGYFSKVADDGSPKDRRKHAYLNAFALYGLVAYHRATKDAAALVAAKELFRMFEEKMYDRTHGGYVEFFSDDWRPITDPRASTYVGAVGTKTYNTHLHLLEAFAELYGVWPDAQVRHRLSELILINTTTVRHPEFPCNIDGWRRDWRMVDSPRNLRASYGHDVECAWLTLDATRRLGRPAHLLRGWAEGLCQASLRHGYDRQHGGFFYAGPPGQAADDTKKEWWVQAEAVVAMLEMYRLTGKSEYYDAFRGTLDFIEKHQVAPEGSWWATRKADGSPQSNQRSSPWHGAYHGGRAMLLGEQLLREFAEQR